MRHLTVTVPQGVGDIFWCYQKLITQCDKISFRIGVTRTGDSIQARSESIIKSLPNVVDVSLQVLDHRKYNALISDKYNLRQCLGHDAFSYSLNTLLDSGVRLEDIDKYPVKYDIELPLESFELPEKYCVFYVSGTTSNKAVVRSMGLWTFEQWAELINKIDLPVVLVGALFDVDAMNQIKARCHNVIIQTQLKPEKLFYLLKNAQFFVGYQSGLSVLADNLGIKHLIVYFNKLPKMQDSWGHPERRLTHFKWCLFSDGIEKAYRLICS